jgi:hypothetical protein
VDLITTETVAGKLTAYLHHELDLAGLVDWAEDAMMEGRFDPEHHDVIRDAVSRLGLADVKCFALAWEDCERFLTQMGYEVRIEVVAH